jgi:hypothetical protein
MSQRFGGKHSPRPTGQAVGKAPLGQARPDRVGARVNLLFIAPFAFVMTAFFQPPLGLVSDLGAFGLLMLAAWLTREGERAHQAWEARAIARRPAIPRKIFASVLTAAALAIGAWLPGDNLFTAALLGLIGGGLHLLAFGPDPMRDKGMEGQDRFQTERVAQAVAEAEKTLTTMHGAISRLRDRQLLERIEAFAATARAMFRRIEEDPRDLTSSRRYLSVYLNGARDATVQFSDLYSRNRDAGARGAYLALIDDLSTRFARQSDLLLSNDRGRLDIEIEVLRERLAREAQT